MKGMQFGIAGLLKRRIKSTVILPMSWVGEQHKMLKQVASRRNWVPASQQ